MLSPTFVGGIDQPSSTATATTAFSATPATAFSSNTPASATTTYSATTTASAVIRATEAELQVGATHTHTAATPPSEAIELPSGLGDDNETDEKLMLALGKQLQFREIAHRLLLFTLLLSFLQSQLPL